jgi:hypothetical protein
VFIGGYTTANPKMNLVDTSYLNDVQMLDLSVSPPRWLPCAFPFVLTPPRAMHSATLVSNNSSMELSAA